MKASAAPLAAVAVSSDVAFSPAVKAVQAARGSRAAYARVEAHGGFESVVTDDLRGFLATIDTAFLATASADGQPYVQHRGGAKGFLRALDDRTIAFLDLAGNRQYVTTGNLTENARVCLFLIDYARRQRVKIWGTARVLPLTPELLAKLDPTSSASASAASAATSAATSASTSTSSSSSTRRAGRVKAEQVIAIDVTAWDVNCPQHIPQKLDASDVAIAIGELQTRLVEMQTRVVELERENARLRSGSATPDSGRAIE